MRILVDEALVVTESDSLYKVETKSILIEDDIIIDVTDNVLSNEFDLIIDGKNKLVIPGLINAHTHSYMTHFRNCADDVPFDKWLFENILPLEDKLVSKDAYWGSMLGIIEMINTGTTCFADMYMFINETALAVEESGIRACLSRGLVDGDGGGERRLKEAISEIEQWKNSSDRIDFLLAPHAPYSCSTDYLKHIVTLSKEDNLALNVHLSESRNEVKKINTEYGVSPTKYLEQLGFFDQRTIAAHCVHLTDEDLEILRCNKVNVATNPISNLKLANGIAPIKELINRDINICIGTDGAASNNSLNMFKEIQMISLIHKGINEDAELISAQESLRFATINGAKALGFEKKIGQIKAGYKADLSILNIDKPQYYPRNNLISALSYSTSGEEVETVIVNGKVLMLKNEFRTIDVERVKYEILKINEKLR